MRKCTKCLEEKPFSGFHKGSNKGYASHCKTCRLTHSKQKYNEDPSSYTKRYNVQKWYGVSLEEYNKAMTTSDKCEICGSQNKLCYDHCHDTMKFRGVLCSNCNLGLGQLGDSLEAVMKAVKYLTKETK